MKVNLRKITLDDTYKIVNWRNQDFVLENFIDRRLISTESHNKYFEERIISGLVDQFIIVCDGKDIGTTFLRDIDYVKKQAEFGIFIGEKDYISKGIGTIACSLILEYGFNILGLEKIFLRVLKNNTRAQKSYLKSGFIIDDSIGNEEEKTNEIFMSKREILMDYSFVIPCYNSSKTIRSVVEEINSTMERLKYQSFNIILVNDFSSDNTKEVIFDIACKHENVIAISMSKNFGQHAALLAGYKYANGDFVISLDDDGQTPANQVDRLINKINEGYDVVFASYNNKHHSAFRNFGSKVNDYMATKLINKPKDLYLSSYFIARKFVIDEMLRYQQPFPYVSGLVLRTTANICNVPVDHRSREIGNSGYNFVKLFKLWLNGFTAFSIKPLRIAVYLGFLIAFFGFLTVIYALINRFTNPNFMIGWTSLIALIAIVGGMILIVLGMIGEYIGRIYISINNSPQYVIREIEGIKDDQK